jgi:CTP:molybdopterin cytidylyltransferase MocA
MTALAVVLAAGAGTRFAHATHKLRAKVHGVAILSRAVANATQSGIGDVVVVTGAETFDDLLPTVTTVHNSAWQTGQRSSVLCAIDEAQRRGCDVVVIAAGDQPFVSPEDWQAVAADPSPVAVATYDGPRATPVRLHKSVWDDFRAIQGDPDAGARSLMHLRPELVSEVACKGSGADIDTTEDLQRWT